MKLALTDSDEAALQQCIASATLYQVYLKFTVDEFTTGEVRCVHVIHLFFCRTRTTSCSECTLKALAGTALHNKCVKDHTQIHRTLLTFSP
jgi:hypothetical protein